MKKLSVLYVCLAAFFWGCMGIFVKNLNNAGLYAINVVQVRMVFSLLLVGIYIAVSNPKRFKIKLKDIWCFLGTGIVSVLFFTWCLFSGMELAPLSVITILLYTAPVFVMVMSIVLFKERITKYKVASLIMTLIGCILVSGIGQGTSVSGIGILFGLGAGFGYALYSIFSRYAIERGYDSWTITFYTFLFCVIGCSFLADNSLIIFTVEEDPSILFWMLGMALFTGFLAYVLYTKGLEGMESSRASIIATLEPVVATVVGTVVFGEPLTFTIIIGILAVVGGIVVLTFQKNK